MADECEPDIFGWELLYSLYEKQFTRKLNVIIVWTHFNLLRRGFKNAGIGEDPSLPNQKDVKETLPFGWHNTLPCRMRYVCNKKLYLITIQDADEDGDVIINMNRPCDNQTTVTTMHVDEIERLSGRLEEVMPDWPVYMHRMAEDIIDPLLKNEASKDIQVQTDPFEEDREDCRRGPRVYHTPAEIPLPTPPRISFVPPVGVGSVDRDPLAGGGGMLFQPPGLGPRPNSLPPDPLVPPGARFDPIFPEGTRPRPRIHPRNSYPDADHLPPPGYDDMFS